MFIKYKKIFIVIKKENMTLQAPQKHTAKEIVQITNNQEEYEAPSLIEYGRVSELTNETGTMNADAVANRRKN